MTDCLKDNVCYTFSLIMFTSVLSFWLGYRRLGLQDVHYPTLQVYFILSIDRPLPTLYERRSKWPQTWGDCSALRHGME